MQKGDILPVKGFSIKEGETSPPKRYTSGSMILAMENAGQLIEDEELRAMIKGKRDRYECNQGRDSEEASGKQIHCPQQKDAGSDTDTSGGDDLRCGEQFNPFAVKPGAYGKLGKKGSPMWRRGRSLPENIWKS